MGLDQYLTKRIYLGAEYKHNKIEGHISLTKNGKPVNINPKKVTSINERAGYWRKANHIHNWMVENVQEGEDDCKEYEITTEQMRELLNVCKRVKEDHSLAEELLPTTSGFFFGGTDYDEYYFKDIDDTIVIIEEAFTDTWKADNGTEYLTGDYYYQSSW